MAGSGRDLGGGISLCVGRAWPWGEEEENGKEKEKFSGGRKEVASEHSRSSSRPFPFQGLTVAPAPLEGEPDEPLAWWRDSAR